MVSHVPLDAKLAESLRQTAAQQGADLENLLNELVEKYLREVRHAQLLAEMERFRAQHANLLETYRGEYIGMYEGRVLDHDPDGGALNTRLRREYGDLSILIVQVTESPEQEFTIRNPRLEVAE